MHPTFSKHGYSPFKQAHIRMRCGKRAKNRRLRGHKTAHAEAASSLMTFAPRSWLLFCREWWVLLSISLTVSAASTWTCRRRSMQHVCGCWGAEGLEWPQTVMIINTIINSIKVKYVYSREMMYCRWILHSHLSHRGLLLKPAKPHAASLSLWHSEKEPEQKAQQCSAAGHMSKQCQNMC